MDLLSYNYASKAAREKELTKSILGEDVSGEHKTMGNRINKLDESVGKITEKANKLIIHNAINIAKAHEKLNSIAKTKKYNLYQLLFDDLLDLSGIDEEESKNYSYSSTAGIITAQENAEIVIDLRDLDTSASQLLFIPQFSYESTETIFLLFNEEVWTEVHANDLIYLEDKGPKKIKIKMNQGLQLTSYAYAWV